jgi:glucose-6-phosphate isomerase
LKLLPTKPLLSNALKESGLNPADHMAIVTDPKSPLDVSARSEGLSVINADPTIGGRFSALSAFGLVPAALLGTRRHRVVAGRRRC